jgi:hypothetical protein
MGWCSQLLLRSKEVVWDLEEHWAIPWAPHSCLTLMTVLHADPEWSLSLLWKGFLRAPHGVLSLTVICDFRTCAESQYTSVDSKCRVEAIGIAHRRARQASLSDLNVQVHGYSWSQVCTENEIPSMSSGGACPDVPTPRMPLYKGMNGGMSSLTYSLTQHGLSRLLLCSQRTQGPCSCGWVVVSSGSLRNEE